MKNSALFTLLKNFSKAEFKEFGKFIRSPYHNNRSELVRYYQKLSKIYPEFNSSKMKESFFSDIYPGKKIKPVDIDRLNSYMLALCKDFLAVSEFDKLKITKKKLLLDKLSELKADKLFQKESIRSIDELTGSKPYDEYFDNYIIIDSAVISHNLTNSRQFNICENVVNRGNFETIDYIIKLSKSIVDMNCNRVSFGYDFHGSLAQKTAGQLQLEELFRDFKFSSPQHKNLVYFHIFRLNHYLNPGSTEYYFKMKDITFEDAPHTTSLINHERFLYLTDAIQYLLLNGKEEFHDEYYSMHKYAHENNLINFSLFRKEEAFGVIRHVCMSGIANGDIDFVKKYLAEHINFISGDLREDFLNFFTAYAFVQEKKYNEALQILSRVKFTSPFFKIDVKNQYLIIYYETNEFDAFYSLAESYKKSLKNSKLVSNIPAETILTNINNSVKLMNIKVTGKYKLLDEFRIEIKKSKIMYSTKKWFYKKIDELVNSKR